MCVRLYVCVSVWCYECACVCVCVLVGGFYAAKTVVRIEQSISKPAFRHCSTAAYGISAEMTT